MIDSPKEINKYDFFWEGQAYTIRSPGNKNQGLQRKETLLKPQDTKFSSDTPNSSFVSRPKTAYTTSKSQKTFKNTMCSGINKRVVGT